VKQLVRVLATLVAIVVVGGAALGGSLALLVPAGREVVFGTTSHAALAAELTKPSERSLVYDRFGNLMSVLYAEDRSPIALEEVPDHLVDAVLAIEDRNFYEHNGVDLKATGRALFRNLEVGDLEQGGSTITQQLVKNTLIDDPQRDIRRKIREAALAFWLEDELTKDEILERYLNVIYLGQGAYGVRSASERYFRKQPVDLTLGEAALLAGLIRSPEGANPISNPSGATRRRELVLRAMVETGAITRQQASVAEQEPLPTEAYTPLPQARDYFLEEVKSRLLNDDPLVPADVAEVLGTTKEERYQKVFRGGLRIHTTFDPFLQVKAVAAVNDILPDSEFTAALVAIDNATGAVRAMVGGRNFEQAKFNVATQGIRQTGSAFKAITLAAALRAGYAPDDSVNSSAPCRFAIPGSEPWIINASGGGILSVTDATARSLNCAFARIAISLGPEKIVDMAHRLGIRKELQAVPSITLGTQPTSVLEMAGAFSVFATEGVRHDPIFVTRVEASDGTLLFSARTRGQHVLDENLARSETQVLRKVITSGTGRAADIGRPAAGKTGTTDEYSDAWFVGYTPQLTASVWMGHPNRVVPMRGVGGINVTGGSYPARIWSAFMRSAHADQLVIDFTPPDDERWPDRGFIDERGRRVSSARGSAPPTTVPVVPAPAPAPVAPPTTVAAPPPTTAPEPADTAAGPG
jgi:penicillin-binding protein 1A